MEPTLGWVLLSRDALKRAEDHLRDGEQGVRDEIGFLTLHQAYAERFFPGTSVLQTRLRYILFVPWHYNDALKNPGRLSVSKFIQEQERLLAKRLKDSYEQNGADGDGLGIIGRRAYPNLAAQPPSMIYWTALRTWGILRPLNDGSLPSRATAHRLLTHRQSKQGRFIVRDDDKTPLDDDAHLFISLPGPPEAWNNAAWPIHFDLTREEKNFLRRQLSGIQRPNEAGSQSLLARLVEKNMRVFELPAAWHRQIRRVADTEDQAALERAGYASSLAAIGRAVYAALVEQICEQWDQRPVSSEHRDWLTAVIADHKVNALRLAIDAIPDDAPNIIGTSILEVLRETQHWLANNRDAKPLDLLDLFRQVEVSRKGNRARLAQTLTAKERRLEWSNQDFPLAAPLHYRWPTVKRLLRDLEETDE